MAASKEELIAKLYDCVVEMDDDAVAGMCEEYLEAGYNVYDGIMDGLVAGMNRASELYDAGEYSVTDVLFCSDALYAGLAVLRPHLRESDVRGETKKVVIGVIEGDSHDVGKNLVKVMLDVAGFEVHDLGRDVSPDAFVAKAKEVDADIIAVSTFMTTTMSGIEALVSKLEEAGIRDRVKVMVGGSPVGGSFADRIGADGYSASAAEAVVLAKKLTGLD